MNPELKGIIEDLNKLAEIQEKTAQIFGRIANAFVPKLDCGCSDIPDEEVYKIQDMTACEEHYAKYKGD